ncbi:MAG: GTP-binding protein, partial [Planctomycetales bacterium]
MMDCTHIRNFSIVAHIDHGKSTLADRLLEITGTISKRDLREQVLDDLDLERDRGITIKARAVSMHYTPQGERFELNLIDTPGHVDFHYEVSRSLACCESVLLLVDACQGVQAQTMANAYAALEHNLEIVPVVNKIDMPNARLDDVAEEMETLLGIDPADLILVSAKTGQGCKELLDEILRRTPAPQGDPNEPLQAMVFDSHYDEYRGAITYVRMMNGTVEKGQRIRFLKADQTYEVLELGRFAPQRVPGDQLSAGQVGDLIWNNKSVQDV